MNKFLKKTVAIFLSLLVLNTNAFALCKTYGGMQFLPLITNLCWECIFPLRIASIDIMRGPMNNEPALSGSHVPLCTCPAPPPIFVRIGIPVSYFEPSRLAEGVSDPYCFPALGMNLAGAFSTTGALGGTQGSNEKGQENTFFQMHWYVFPVFAFLQIFTDLICAESTGFDMLYMTELDPFWQDDSASAFLQPEAALFGNPVAQLACSADAVSANIARYSLEPLFWCKGSWGSAYPLAGNVHAKNFVEDSASVTSTFIYKLHREMLLWNQFGPGIMLCSKWPSPVWFKNAYRLQLMLPRSQGQAMVIGESGIKWTIGKNIPFLGDNFAYVVFKKKECCAF